MNVTVFVVGTDADPMPLWQRTLMQADDGTLYLPWAVAGSNQQSVFLCASYDGVQCVMDETGHTYYPVEWLSREFPAAREVCETATRRMKDLAP